MQTGQWHIAGSSDGMTMAFLTMSMCEIFHSFNMRSRRKSIFSLGKRNIWLWGSAATALILTTIVIEIPALAKLFDFTVIGAGEYLAAMSLALMIIPIVEAVKAVQRAKERKKAAAQKRAEDKAKKRA